MNLTERNISKNQSLHFLMSRRHYCQPKMNRRPSISCVLWTMIGIFLGLHALVYIYKRSSHSNTFLIPDKGHAGIEVESPAQGKDPASVDFRIIVLTYNRPQSLLTLLKSLDNLILDGDKAILEIWIDRSKKSGAVNNLTLETANSFNWTKGKSRVHVQKQHAGLYGQWIDTWSPKNHDNEIALILEDDMSVSPFAYRWLKAGHSAYRDRSDISGFTLQSEGVPIACNSPKSYLSVDKKHKAFAYKLLGSWGFSPNPIWWSKFQGWFHDIRKNHTKFHPYVANASRITSWYKGHERGGREEHMWTMWFVYFCDKNNIFCVYNNLNNYTGNKKNQLSANRKEAGLHFAGKLPDSTAYIMTEWSDDFKHFPSELVRFDWNGNML